MTTKFDADERGYFGDSWGGRFMPEALIAALDRSMGRVDEACQPFGKPVIAPSLPPTIVHSLLDHHPFAVVGDDETMQIKVEAILDGGAINLCDEPTRGRER